MGSLARMSGTIKGISHMEMCMTRNPLTTSFPFHRLPLSPSPPVDLQANNNGHSDDNGDTSGSESTVARVTSSEGPLRIRISGIQGKQEDTSAEIDGNGNGGGGASRNKGTSSSKSSSSSYPDVNAGAFVATTTRRTPRDDDDAAASDPSRYVNRYGEGVICLAVHTNCNNHHQQQQSHQSQQGNIRKEENRLNWATNARINKI